MTQEDPVKEVGGKRNYNRLQKGAGELKKAYDDMPEGKKKLLVGAAISVVAVILGVSVRSI